jgi:uncharacterized protein YqjF (DUF2071 family)
MITPVEKELEDEPGVLAKGRMLSVRGEPLLLADWDRAAFLHFEVDPGVLRQSVPYPLDLYDGRAFVSLVTFTMRRLRCVRAQRLTEWLMKPIGTQPYLNVRTYVCHRGEPGIFFLAEWMTNPFSLYLGGPLFGLPYRYGEACYQNEPATGRARGEVRGASGTLFSYQVACENGPPVFLPAERGSLDEFLVERYTCFTQWHRWRRAFRVWHPPWRIAEASAAVPECGLLEQSGPWFQNARLQGAHLSPGCHDVWMGRPQSAGFG